MALSETFDVGNALVVSAHSADCVWRAGGAIASHVKQGWNVKIVCPSFGERGEPNTFLDITDVWETKRRAIECMAGQEHLWHYYTRVAQQRGVQAKRNIGITAARNIEYAEGFMQLAPNVVDSL